MHSHAPLIRHLYSYLPTRTLLFTLSFSHPPNYIHLFIPSFPQPLLIIPLTFLSHNLLFHSLLRRLSWPATHPHNSPLTHPFTTHPLAHPLSHNTHPPPPSSPPLTSQSTAATVMAHSHNTTHSSPFTHTPPLHPRHWRISTKFPDEYPPVKCSLHRLRRP